MVQGGKGWLQRRGVRQTEQCKACSSCAEMEEADGLEALLRQSMKLGEAEASGQDSRREKGRQHKQRTNQREREGGSNVRESGGIGTVYLWVAPCSLPDCSPTVCTISALQSCEDIPLPNGSLAGCTLRDGAQCWLGGKIGPRVCSYGPHKCLLPDAACLLRGISSRASHLAFFISVSTLIILTPQFRKTREACWFSLSCKGMQTERL
jgi:hypothetical protein